MISIESCPSHWSALTQRLLHIGIRRLHQINMSSRFTYKEIGNKNLEMYHTARTPVKINE